MKLIDEELGGTTPLDIIITFKEDNEELNNQYQIDVLVYGVLDHG